MAEPRVGRLTRERRRELTRTALIEAAAELFGRQGFHATSLEEIANAAGFTRGAIYKNFKSKEDILIAVVEWHVELQLAAYADALESAEATPSDRVSAAADVWARVFQRDANLNLLELELRLHALRNPDFRPRLATWERQHADRVAAFIADQARAAGLRLSIPPEDLSRLTLGAVEGLSLAASIHPEERDRYDRLVGLFFRLVSEGLVEPARGKTAAKRPTRSR